MVHLIPPHDNGCGDVLHRIHTVHFRYQQTNKVSNVNFILRSNETPGYTEELPRFLPDSIHHPPCFVRFFYARRTSQGELRHFRKASLHLGIFFFFYYHYRTSKNKDFVTKKGRNIDFHMLRTPRRPDSSSHVIGGGPPFFFFCNKTKNPNSRARTPGAVRKMSSP